MKTPVRALRALWLAPLALFLATCKVPGSKSVSGTDSAITTAFVTNYTGDFSYNLDVGPDSHDVYFVFSNKAVDTSATAASVSSNTVGSIKVNGSTIAQACKQPAGGPSASSAKAKDLIDLSNSNIRSLFSSGKLKASSTSAVSASRASSVVGRVNADTAGSTNTAGGLYDLNSSDNQALVNATCRSVTTVATAQGSRTLNIWVSDACWTDTGTQGIGSYPNQKHLVTPTMVDNLAEEFLSDGQNDIYGYDTAILGPEWGTPTGSYASYLIPFDANITILLSDIEQDNNDDGSGSNGVVVGYYWNVNNFADAYMQSQGYHSNERIMFVIDSDLYANPSSTGATGTGSSGWDPSTSYWAKECYSTLAHEFQHMIHFYRKGVVIRGDCQSADTWINEMCSQLVEDLVASKLDENGPRGVACNDPTAGSAGNTNGRIPYFNEYLSSIDRQLTKTSDYDVLDYSFSYAFGSWLLRNYGGSQFVRNVVYDSATDETCVTDAVRAYSGRNLSLGDLIQRWAVAILGSSRTDMPVGYRYNTGSWVTSSSGSQTYQLGSIDFFNYSPAPQVLSGSTSTGSIAAASNVYYLAKSGMTGSDKWTLSLPANVAFSVYVSP